MAEKEHSFNIIARDLKNDDIRGAILLYGQEQYLVTWAYKQITSKYVNPASMELDLTVIEGDNISITTIKAACETFPLLSEKRVVIVKGLKALDDGKGKALAESDEKDLIDFVSKVPDSSLLIFVAEKVDARKKLFKTIAKSGKVYEFDALNEKDLRSFINKRFKEAGKRAEVQVINKLAQSSGYLNKDSGYTLYNLENDIGKIIAYSERDEISIADILSVTEVSLETSMFGMLDAIGEERKGDALRLVAGLLGRDENVYPILGMLVSQFELILSIRELQELRYSYRETAEILEVHEYRVKKSWAFAGKFTAERLKKALVEIYDIDKHIKTGNMPGRLAIELFIAGI